MKNKTFYILSALLAAGFIGYILYRRFSKRKEAEETPGTFPVNAGNDNSGNTAPVNTERPASETTTGTVNTETNTGTNTATNTGTTTGTTAGQEQTVTSGTQGTIATYTPPATPTTGSVIRAVQMNPARAVVRV